jgi:glucose dehydrogenase
MSFGGKCPADMYLNGLLPMQHLLRCMSLHMATHIDRVVPGLNTGVALRPYFAIGPREGGNLYSGSIVVLDAKTGAYKNHFKLVPKDWHDWDVSTAPALIQTQSGKKLLSVAPKDGAPLRL